MFFGSCFLVLFVVFALLFFLFWFLLVLFFFGILYLLLFCYLSKAILQKGEIPKNPNMKSAPKRTLSKGAILFWGGVLQIECFADNTVKIVVSRNTMFKPGPRLR